MAITHTEVDYLLSANAGDELVLGTWLTDWDGRFRSARQFQLIRVADGKTLLRGLSTHACVDMKASVRPGTESLCRNPLRCRCRWSWFAPKAG